jgi:hypothetical protein
VCGLKHKMGSAVDKTDMKSKGTWSANMHMNLISGIKCNTIYLQAPTRGGVTETWGHGGVSSL